MQQPTSSLGARQRRPTAARTQPGVEDDIKKRSSSRGAVRLEPAGEAKPVKRGEKGEDVEEDSAITLKGAVEAYKGKNSSEAYKISIRFLQKMANFWKMFVVKKSFSNAVQRKYSHSLGLDKVQGQVSMKMEIDRLLKMN